jgi:hypothetical protein
LLPKLREQVEAHGVEVFENSHPIYRKCGAVFAPAGILEPDDPAILTFPTRFTKPDQHAMALLLKGFFQGLKVANLRREEESEVA